MRRHWLFLVLSVVVAGAWSSGGGSDADDEPDAWDLPDEFTAVLARFIGPETAPVRGSDGKFHLVYELWLTNGKQVPATVDSIEVLDHDDRDVVLATLEGEELLDATRQLSTQPAEDTDLAPNESVLIFVSLTFDSKENVPDRIVHRFRGTGADNPGSREPTDLDYLFGPWDISRRTTPVIGAPLAGDGWVVVNGCCTGEGAHRGAVQTVNGTLYDSQRFAIDWMRIDADGRFVDGDPADPANWNAYDAPVFAVADGTVVEVLDGLDDQVPGELPDPRSITLETVDGNHVILDLGNGVYAFYAHLQSGSITVEKGDKVDAGDELGRLGNSGNTSAPHLHIHLMTRPSAIASDSIPYQFDSFRLQGSVDREQWFAAEDLDVVFAVVELDDPGRHKQQLPLDLSIVGFGGGRREGS